MRSLLFLAMLVSGGGAAAAGPICADRPGQSTPTCTVSAGHWQVETGLASWSLRKGGGERETELAVGETNVRFGLSGRSEIQVDVTPWQRARAPGERASGLGDVTILYKHRLTADEAAVKVALAPVMKVPTAKRSLGNGKWEAALRLPVDVAFGESQFSLNLTPEIGWNANSDGRGHHSTMVQAASLGWQASERLSLSAELWGQWDWDPGGTTRQASADGAVAYLLSRDVQLDAGANFGLNKVTPDVQVYAGFSKRF